MAKTATAPAPGMTLPEMKSVLNRATRDKPAKVAFAQAKDKSALLSLDMSKGAKILSKTLELEHQDAKDFRWGFAFVDEAEPTTVKFRINKAARGMGKRLVKTLKGTGYNDVIFLEDGSGDILDPKQDVVLGGSQEEPDEDGVVPPPQGVAPPPPPGPPPSTAPLYDAKELEAMLRSLIPQIPGAAGSNADLLAQLKKYAADANLFIKTNNLKTAAENLKALGDAIDAAKAGGGTAPTTTAPANLAKVRAVWQTAQQKITADIDNLRAQLVETYKPEKLDGEVRQRYDAKVAKLLAAVRADLGEKIDALGTAADPDARKTLVEGAKTIITGYQTALADPVVPDLDKNPFVPLGIQNALKALSGLAAAIH